MVTRTMYYTDFICSSYKCSIPPLQRLKLLTIPGLNWLVKISVKYITGCRLLKFKELKLFAELLKCKNQFIIHTSESENFLILPQKILTCIKSLTSIL